MTAAGSAPQRSSACEKQKTNTNPGPLVQAYDGLGTVQPIVFGYQAEASAGACDLIKSVADELAPRYAGLYLLESVEAAVGIATDRLREEFGAAVFKAQARVVLDRTLAQ